MFYINEILISSQKYKKRLYDFFYRDVKGSHQVPRTPLFSVTQHHKKRWDTPTPYVWRNYWTAPLTKLTITKTKRDLLYVRSIHWRCSIRKSVLKNFGNLAKNNCVEVCIAVGKLRAVLHSRKKKCNFIFSTETPSKKIAFKKTASKNHV